MAAKGGLSDLPIDREELLGVEWVVVKLEKVGKCRSYEGFYFGKGCPVFWIDYFQH